MCKQVSRAKKNADKDNDKKIWAGVQVQLRRPDIW